ncbi:MAG: DUF4271 domain-containing protein [Bacteroidales bacterium]|nr:DUF4271 domain-containing protein [Bacteroidales bacterium]
MGRRRRNQDTIQASNADQMVGSQDGQLQVTQTPAESVNQTEPKVVTQTVEEIPYEDRPIPEAYFPPEEEETVQEFMPEPNIQKTVVPAVKKPSAVSIKEIEALMFDVKPVGTNSSEVSGSKQTGTNPVSNSVELGQKTDAKGTPVYTKNFDFNTLRFGDNPIDTSNSNVGTLVAPMAIADSLTAKNDSIANDSLAKDSVVFIPVEEPEPKREIISIDGKEMPQTINNMWWYPLSLLVIFIAYVIIIRDRKKAILSELISFVKPNTDGSIFGFQWLQNSKYKFFLSTLGVITASLYLFLANRVAISAIWIFFLAVTVFVVGKKVMLALLEYIYFEGADVASMSGAFMVMVRQAGLALIPAVLGLSFAPEEYRSFFIYFGIIVVAIAILAFNLKVIVNFLRGITSIFYLILYLCTLEVIPVAIFFVLGLLPRL